MSENAEIFLNNALSNLSQPLSENKLRQFIDHSPALIKKSLEPFGYFNSSVHYQINTVSKTWEVYYTIEKGPPIKIDQIKLNVIGEGKHNAALEVVLQQLPLEKHDSFNTVIYEKMKADLINTLAEQGYIYAFFQKKSLNINLQKLTCTIDLEINTGKQYYYGEIFYDNHSYSPTLLHRFITLRSGEVFSAKKLLEEQQELEKSQFFDNVTLTPVFSQTKDQHIPIRFSATVPKAKAYLFGIGYGTLTGPRLTASIDARRVNEKGHHFNSKFQFSSILKALSAKYYIPGRDPINDKYTFGANIQQFNPKKGQSKSESVSVGYDHARENWQTHITLNGLNEHYFVENQPSHTSHLVYPALNILYSKADDLLKPTEGKAFNLNLQGGSRYFFASTDFFQAEMKAKYFWSPTENSHVILRGGIGYTAVRNLQALPLTLRFFTGGINSIRGYEDSSIGPGKYLQFGSVEYQHKIYDNWYGALFYDMGTADNHFNKNFKRSEGVGVVYYSLIGPIRVYVARAMDLRNKPYHIELSIGPDL